MSLNPVQLQATVEEAERFLARVNDLQDHGVINPYHADYEGGPLCAAVKRASLDLTRSLSKLRNNQQ